jgi:hypothetical protein
MKKNPDGSLTIYLQNKSPGKDKEAKLAAGARGTVACSRPQPAAHAAIPIFLKPDTDPASENPREFRG